MRLLILASLGALMGAKAYGFPEMSRLGYFACSSCHVSAAGGDVLTDYGRSIAADRLSTWADDEEESSNLKLYPTAPDWFLAGGYARGVAVDTETVKGGERKLIRMQTDMAAAVQVPHFTALAEGGEVGNGPPNEDQGAWRQYWAQGDWRGLSARAGRFLPRYGLNVPQHVINVRSQLGFDDGSENQAYEISWLGERDEAALTRFVGAREPYGSHEEGWAATYSHQLAGQKVTASLLQGKQLDGSSRWTCGLAAVIGSPRWFLLTEGDYNRAIDAQGYLRHGAYLYNRLAYEPVQGLIPFIVGEASAPDLIQIHTRTESYGAGIQWYPRPHIDFEAQWEATLIMPTYTYITTGYLMAHYYL